MIEKFHEVISIISMLDDEHEKNWWYHNVTMGCIAPLVHFVEKMPHFSCKDFKWVAFRATFSEISNLQKVFREKYKISTLNRWRNELFTVRGCLERSYSVSHSTSNYFISRIVEMLLAYVESLIVSAGENKFTVSEIVFVKEMEEFLFYTNETDKNNLLEKFEKAMDLIKFELSKRSVKN